MHTLDDNSIMPHEEFLAQMERDKRANYMKGAIALIGVAVMIAFLLLATSQLAAGGSVFLNG